MMGYDKDGHTVYTKLGNGTETTYAYDKQRQRLQDMMLTDGGSVIMQNKYKYDAVDNILGITNAADPMALINNKGKSNGNINKANLGGASHHTYEYDDLNRLIHANGKAKNVSYDMAMTFGLMSEPLTKVQRVDSSRTAKSYDFVYKYENENHPTAPTLIGQDHYTYDADGNPILVVNDSTNTERKMYWDEDDRLMVLSDNGRTSRYTYNAAGDRIIKSHGTMEGVYINGAPQGITFHETDDFTLYPASILTVNKNRFTKHYFIGSQRIASRIGSGSFNNVYGRNSSYVTAGQQDYAQRMADIESQREEYYKQQGIAPGVPTEKGAYGDPENTGVGYNSIITELGDHSVPEGWVQTPKHNDEQGSNPGAPISWNDPTNPDDPQPGYGYIADDTTSVEDTYFFHSDHLGSTSYITDAKGNVNQYDAYLPYGELLVDEHSSSEDMPYKFNGKEFDEETGLYYYGARYMDPVISMWYGVDKLAEAYTNIGNYVYCHDQPLSRIDIGGNWDVKVSASSNRGAHPYAIYTVSDRKGNVIYETVVKVLGNSRIRNAPKADTPQGRYKILGWRKTGKGTRYNTTSFGVNDLLALEYQGGEGGNRQGMHTHGGRPRKDRLVGTHGCIRMADDDIKELKEIVTNLENYDPKEKKGFLTVTDDLKTPVNYSQREEIKQRRNIGYTLDEVVVVGKRPEKAINNPNKDNHKTQRR